MTLKLILTRHAKSAWDDPLADDFDRTLNQRGQRAAVAIGHWLVEQGHIPDRVVASAARRTCETWERMAHLMPNAAFETRPALYMAGPDVILSTLHRQPAEAIMIICHNPGIAEFAGRIVTAPADHKDFNRYPSGATTVIAFEASAWKDVPWASGQVLGFAAPRELER